MYVVVRNFFLLLLKTVLPGPAWLLLNKICILFPGPLYYDYRVKGVKFHELQDFQIVLSQRLIASTTPQDCQTILSWLSLQNIHASKISSFLRIYLSLLMTSWHGAELHSMQLEKCASRHCPSNINYNPL